MGGLRNRLGNSSAVTSSAAMPCTLVLAALAFRGAEVLRGERLLVMNSGLFLGQLFWCL